MNAIVKTLDDWSTTDSTIGYARVVDRRRAAPRLRAPTLLVESEPKYAPWLDEVMAQMEELVRLPEDWDTYGASAPSRAAANALFEVLLQTTSVSTPCPAIVPSPAGHFQAEWHENGVDLEVEVISPSHIDVCFGSDHAQWNRVLRSDLKALVDAIDQLAV